MKSYFDKLHKSENETEEDKKRRYILYIIIIIIIILLLITSCSCTSKFLGKIGDFFNNGGTHTIDDGTDDKEVRKNKELQFDNNNVEMSLSDERMKLSFSYKNINPSIFSCSTSDANIATCYVSNDYVVVIPKTTGKIVVTLHTSTNGKVYEATANVTITDATRSIKLSSNNGTINLAITKNKNIPFTLEGLNGDIIVTSSDDSIATGVAKDGMLQITAYKTGKVTFTLSLTYNDVTYTEKYTLNVINQSGGSSGNVRPGKPSNPNEDNPKPPVKDPVYEVNISKIYDGDSPYYLEDYSSKNPYYLKYEVLKDGVLDTDSIKNVKIGTSDNIKAEIVKINGEYFIKVTPNSNVKPKDKATITISSNGKTEEATIDFKIHDYDLTISPTEYNLNYIDGSGSETFIIKTGNLFKESINVTEDNQNKIKICSSNNKTCVNVEVLEEYRDYIKISYDGNKDATSALPIKVTITDKVADGNIGATIDKYIRVSGSIYGETLKINGNDYQDIKINLVENNILTIYPNNKFLDGYFSSISIANGKNVPMVIPISYDEKINLKDYIAFGINKENDCLYYPIKEFNTASDGSGKSYSIDSVITNLTSSLTLYPIFEGKPENITPDQTTKKLYLADVDIFRYFKDKKGNQYEGYYKDEYGNEHEGSPIFPGVEGAYVITLNNNSRSELIIKGLTLTEDTICLPEGCLNIGYKIRYTTPDIDYFTYYYGSEDKYAILNQDSWKRPNMSNPNRSVNYNEIEFNPMIIVPLNKGIEISLFWKWVEGEDISNDKKVIKEYDEIDTAIGTYVADKINEMYTLTVSIDFAQNKCNMMTN